MCLASSATAILVIAERPSIAAWHTTAVTLAYIWVGDGRLRGLNAFVQKGLY